MEPETKWIEKENNETLETNDVINTTTIQKEGETQK